MKLSRSYCRFRSNERVRTTRINTSSTDRSRRLKRHDSTSCLVLSLSSLSAGFSCVDIARHGGNRRGAGAVGNIAVIHQYRAWSPTRVVDMPAIACSTIDDFLRQIVLTATNTPQAGGAFGSTRHRRQASLKNWSSRADFAVDKSRYGCDVGSRIRFHPRLRVIAFAGRSFLGSGDASRWKVVLISHPEPTEKMPQPRRQGRPRRAQAYDRGSRRRHQLRPSLRRRGQEIGTLSSQPISTLSTTGVLIHRRNRHIRKCCSKSGRASASRKHGLTGSGQCPCPIARHSKP